MMIVNPALLYHMPIMRFDLFATSLLKFAVVMVEFTRSMYAVRIVRANSLPHLVKVSRVLFQQSNSLPYLTSIHILYSRIATNIQQRHQRRYTMVTHIFLSLPRLNLSTHRARVGVDRRPVVTHHRTNFRLLRVVHTQQHWAQASSQGEQFR